LTNQNRKISLIEGEKATLITLLVNILLSIFKLLTGFFIGSVALLASGFDALTDLIASIAVLLGLRFAQKDPSKRFPYGYYRMETLATLVVALIIIFFGLEVIIESYRIIITPSQLIQPFLGLIIAAISILAAFGLSRYNQRIGKKIDSNALLSTAKEFQLDIITNLLVFFGILAHLIYVPQLEGIVGLIIGLFIIKTGFEFGKASLLTLLDALDDPDIVEKIRKIGSQYQEIQEIINVRIRRSGPYYFADIEIMMYEKETVKSIGDVTHKLESHLKREISQIDSIMISVEPLRKTQLVLAIAIPSLVTSFNGSPAEHFGKAAAFIVSKVDIKNQILISSRIVENPYHKEDKKRGILTAELLVEEGVDALAILDPKLFGIGPKAILNDANIFLHQYRKETIKEIIDEFIITQAKITNSKSTILSEEVIYD
jgi:cation diffusion facilitator family transporter